MPSKEKRKKFYITTAIDYVNGRPHIGHALEKIQADALARFYRTRDYDVRFLTGTDEHGVKIVRAAVAAHKDPQRFVDEMSENFRALKNGLNLSWDDFIRTSDRIRHWPGAERLWTKLREAGDLYQKNTGDFIASDMKHLSRKKTSRTGSAATTRKNRKLLRKKTGFFDSQSTVNTLYRRLHPTR